jgi:hypothetical protein
LARWPRTVEGRVCLHGALGAFRLCLGYYFYYFTNPWVICELHLEQGMRYGTGKDGKKEKRKSIDQLELLAN